MNKITILLTICCCFGVIETDAGAESCHSIDEITLVTGYFDNGYRNDVYMSWFEKWARIKNVLVVFCQNEEVKSQIFNIRKKFGVENRTKFVIIDDIFSIDRRAFNKMVEISKDSHFTKFRGSEGDRESNAGYDYIVNLKPYLLRRADLEFQITTENIAWIDFGFNHGGEFFSHEEDWSFNLRCGSSDKVRVFYVSPKLEKRPLFDVIRTIQPWCIAAGFFICPKKLLNTFYNVCNFTLYEMLNIDLMDTEQPVLLLAARLHPELFEVMRSYWFLPVKQYCNGHHLRFNMSYLNRRYEVDAQYLIQVVMSLNSTSKEKEDVVLGLSSVKVSVIIPVYNTEKYISDCLQSVMSQTLSELQIICVDDGSSDRSLQVMNGLAKVDKRILVIHQENCGVSCARNTGLSVATGEYVTFVDSDDFLINSDAYRRIYEKAKEMKVDVVVWGFLDGSQNDKKILQCNTDTSFWGIESARFFFPNQNRQPCVKTTMYKRTLLSDNNITFDVSTQFGEDFLFNFDLIPFIGSLYCISRSFYNYSHRPEGLDRRRRLEDEDAFNTGIYEHLEKLRNYSDCKNCLSDEDIKVIELFLEKRKNLAEGRRKLVKARFARLTMLYGERRNYWNLRGNYGDCFQSFAVENIYNGMGIPSAKLIFVNQDGLDLYRGEPVVLIMQGWFESETSLDWSPKITPVFLGFRLQKGAQKRFIDDGIVEKMKRLQQPIGCGDLQTVDFLKSVGINAYFSGCLTMTLPKRETEPSNGKIFIADVQKEFFPKIPESLRGNSELVHMYKFEGIHISEEVVVDFEFHARMMLDRFKTEARLVLTSRVDVAMPCVALGIPVVFLHTDPSDSYFDVLKGIVRINTLEDINTVDWNPPVANINDIQDLVKSNAMSRVRDAVYSEYNEHNERRNLGELKKHNKRTKHKKHRM